MAGILAINDLFPHRIGRYATAEDRVSVRSANASGAVHCFTADGRQWVRKGPRGSPLGTFAESVCWLLAKELRVPVPAGAVLDGPRGRIWMSERVPEATHWRVGANVANWDEAVRVLLLDVLVDNGDRHYRNVLLQPCGNGEHRLIPIDYDGAGIQMHMASHALEPTIPHVPSPPFWLSELEAHDLHDHLGEAAADLRALMEANHGQRLEALAHQALEAAYVGQPSSVDVGSVVDYLRWRAPKAQTIAEAYWKEATDEDL